MKPAPKLIVFDLDGTLNRTELFAVEVHRMLQTEFGWPAQSPKKSLPFSAHPPMNIWSACCPVPTTLPNSGI